MTMAKIKSTRERPAAGKPDAARILKDYRSRPALFTKATVFEMDAAIRQDKFGLSRRLALVFLSKSGRDFIKPVSEKRDFAIAVAQAADGFHHYADALRDLLSWIEEAERRSGIALACRPDMKSILAQVAKPQAQVAHG